MNTIYNIGTKQYNLSKCTGLPLTGMFQLKKIKPFINFGKLVFISFPVLLFTIILKKNHYCKLPVII